jgi:hypothetical protein
MSNAGRDWWKDIRRWDVVCDCRYKHQAVEVIEREYIRHYFYPLYFWIPDWLDKWIPQWLDEWLWKIQESSPYTLEMVDMTLTMEDGFKCSAKHCCDPSNHDWEHPVNHI